MKRIALSLFVLSLSVPMFAGTIPYPNTGTIAPTVDTYANSSNGIDLYFFGSTAGFTDYVEVYDIQTGYNSGEVLDNHTSTLGQEVAVGTTPGQINSGDQLVFYIISPEGNLASIPSYSADGVNHAYVTGYAGGVLNGVTIPSGVFVGLEDEANGESDFNYNDDTFVFTGVSAPSIGVGGAAPEPSSLTLMGTGVLAFAGMIRRRFVA